MKGGEARPVYYDRRQWWEEGPPASVSPDSAGLTHRGPPPFFMKRANCTTEL